MNDDGYGDSGSLEPGPATIGMASGTTAIEGRCLASSSSLAECSCSALLNSMCRTMTPPAARKEPTILFQSTAP